MAAHGATPLAEVQVDSTVRNSVFHVVGGGELGDAEADSLRNRVYSFYYDQFRHSQEPGAPYFMFLSKDRSLAMGVGGSVRMRGYYDWGGAIPSTGFAPYLIPMKPNPAAQRQLGTTPAGTALYFRVLGSNSVLGEYQLNIEANFNGYKSRDFHLKKAYASFRDITVGYAPSTFSDPAAQPPVLDGQGVNNKMSHTTVLLRYMPQVWKGVHLGISAEAPSKAIPVDGVKTASVLPYLPEFAALVQYQWARGQHVRLSGVLRSLSYRNLAAAANERCTGWGVQLSSVSHPWAAWTLYATVNGGRGVAGMGGDMSIGQYDLVGVPGQPGRMYAPRSYGWNVGLQYNFLSNLFVSTAASLNRYLPDYPEDASEYRRGLFGAANVFWNITPRMQVGAEFNIGQRTDFSGASRTARRIGAMCMFSF